MKQTSLWDAEEVAVVSNRPVLLAVQSDLIDRGTAPYAAGAKRVLWQASCGSGKTVIASDQTVRALAKEKTVLHVVHRRRLVDQMTQTLRRFGVFASPIMEGRQSWDAKVKCASRDTLLAMLKAGRGLPVADLIIWDEAHVAAAEVQDWYLRNCPQAYWTGYTATPVGSDGRSLSPPYQSLVCMAPTSELMRIGRLCPVKVYDPKAVGEIRKRGDKVKPVGDPVAHWLKFANGLPTVVFAAKVADSMAIVQRYIDAGVTAEHIDASTPESERDAVFERSRKGQTKVISNVGVMVEGVDLPWLVCCQILRGCNSLVLWVQASGRVMRAFPGKTHGIILDHAGAVYDFGPPDSDYQWSLEDGCANEGRNKLPKDRKPVACLSCGFLFSGKPACPECGRVLAKKKRKSLVDGLDAADGILTEFAGSQQQGVLQDARNRLWKKLLFMGRAKGWAMNRVAGIFSKQAKCPPWEAGLDSPLPFGKQQWSASVADWMSMQQAEAS